jgi:hypothetical protein
MCKPMNEFEKTLLLDSLMMFDFVTDEQAVEEFIEQQSPYEVV